MRLLRSSLFALATTFAVLAAGCTAQSSGTDDTTPGVEQDVTADAATLKLGTDFTTSITGEATAGRGLRVEYALERLPQCRGNVGGGGPGWNVTGSRERRRREDVRGQRAHARR